MREALGLLSLAHGMGNEPFPWNHHLHWAFDVGHIQHLTQYVVLWARQNEPDSWLQDKKILARDAEAERNRG